MHSLKHSNKSSKFRIGRDPYRSRRRSKSRRARPKSLVERLSGRIISVAMRPTKKTNQNHQISWRIQLKIWSKFRLWSTKTSLPWLLT